MSRNFVLTKGNMPECVASAIYAYVYLGFEKPVLILYSSPLGNDLKNLFPNFLKNVDMLYVIGT